MQRQVHRLDLSAENDRVRARIDGDIERVHQRLARWSARLRARSGRSGAKLAALREDGRERLRHRRRVGEFQRHQLHHHVLRDRHGVQHRNHGRERLEVVRRGSEHEAVAPALAGHRVGGDLDRLREIQQHGLTGLVLNLEAANLFLKLARLRSEFTLRARLQHVLQNGGELRGVGLLQIHHQHLGLAKRGWRVETANHPLHLIDDVRTRDDEQAARTGVGGHGERVAGAHDVVLRHELLDERENFFRRRIGQGHETEFEHRGLACRVELLDERFEQREVRGPRAHDDAARARLGHHRDARLRGAGLRRLPWLHRHGHRLLLQQITEGARHDDGVGIQQGENAELGLVVVKVQGQLADDAVDVVQLLRRPGEDQRIGVLVHGDDDFSHAVGPWNSRLNGGSGRG